jgi:hypothetical protein
VKGAAFAQRTTLDNLLAEPRHAIEMGEPKGARISVRTQSPLGTARSRETRRRNDYGDTPPAGHPFFGHAGFSPVTPSAAV